MVGGGSGGGNKIVATLRADCKVYPTAEGTTIAQLANLMNYKIRTEGDVKTVLNDTVSVTTPTVDVGKQLLQCARDSDLKGVKNALTRAAPFTTDWLGMSALHFAAMNNQYEMCELLLNGGINKDSKTKVDRTPLHLACFYGNEKIVEILLSRNCAVNPKDMLRMTPLHWAVEKGHKSIVRLLLKHNADVTSLSKFGRTPIALAVLTEQADILEELEAARQLQVNKKYSEENEKETSEAVNSIMGLNNDAVEETMHKLITDDDLTNHSDYGETKMIDLENIKEIGILGDSTINLLKSHGISMMPEDDTSKDLLNTALQRGRQLVLSEGGKLLLNETKKIQNNNNNIVKSNNSNNNKTIVPVASIKSEHSNGADEIAATAANESKINPNIISKTRDHMLISKGKNIRIISLNDFKKLYGNTNIKGLQNVPSALTANRLVKIRPISTKQHQQLANSQTNNDNSNTSASSGATLADSIIEEDEPLPNIITMQSVEIEPENSKSPPPLKIIQPPPRSQGMHLLSTRRSDQIGSVQVRHVHVNNSKPYSSNQRQGSSTVMPLLTLPEVCRQLLDLRKQCEEFRKQNEELRKLDLAQKDLRRQNEELRKQNEEFRRKLAQKEKEETNQRLEGYEEINQRLERLEELLLVERTDEDINAS